MLKERIAKMTLSEKIGQMFQVGFPTEKATDEVKKLISNYHVGGIIYFRRNIASLAQVAELSETLQKTAIESGNFPLLISADQEGGVVTRLKGGTHFPGNMALGAVDDKELTSQIGCLLAEELAAVGINMDLAPVLDVNNNPANPVIGVRSYGSDPALVAKHGTAFMQAMQQVGVVATAKHFPGHGDTSTDSHLDLPVIKHARSRLDKVELYPFVQAIKAGIDAIMAAHIYFPTIEKRAGIPATLSASVLTDLLREELGFNGVIITDCMEMKAIVDNFGTVEGAVMTIEAGTDIVLISHTYQKQIAAIEKVKEAVKSGRISEKRIDASVERILKLKEKRVGLSKCPQISFAKLDLKKNQKVALELGRKSVTLIKDAAGHLPLNKEDKIVRLKFVTDKASLAEDDKKGDNLLSRKLREKGFQLKEIMLEQESANLPDLKDYDKVIVLAYNATNSDYQQKIINQIIAEGYPHIIVSIRNPYDFKYFKDLKTGVVIYDDSASSLAGLADFLRGKIKAKGKLPVQFGVGSYHGN